MECAEHLIPPNIWLSPSSDLSQSNSLAGHLPPVAYVFGYSKRIHYTGSRSVYRILSKAFRNSLTPFHNHTSLLPNHKGLWEQGTAKARIKKLKVGKSCMLTQRLNHPSCRHPNLDVLSVRRLTLAVQQLPHLCWRPNSWGSRPSWKGEGFSG